VQDTDWFRNLPLQTHHIAELLSRNSHKIIIVDFPMEWKTEKKKSIVFKGFNKEVKGRIYENSHVQVIRPPLIYMRGLDRISAQINYFHILLSKICKNIDIIILYGVSTYGLASLLGAKICNKPIIFHAFDALYAMTSHNFYAKIIWCIEHFIYNHVDHIIVISPALIDYMKAHGIKREKITFLPAGTDIKRFSSFSQNEISVFRNEFGFNKEDFIILYSGWLYEFSGLDLLVAAMPRLLKIDPNIKLLIVGEGPLFNKLHRLKEQLKISDKVKLIGRQPYTVMPKIIAMSDLCVNLYLPDIRAYYAFPSKCVEYMAAGKPVILTRFPYIESIFSQEAGIIITNSRNFIDIIEKLLVNKERLKELGKQAQEYSLKHFSIYKIVLRIESILKEHIINP
jgi:glycosyltransferase involved in cell wall biosynthesis